MKKFRLINLVIETFWVGSGTKTGWRARKAAVQRRHHSIRGKRGVRTNGGPWRDLHAMEPVPRNAQVWKTGCLMNDSVWLSVPSVIGSRWINGSFQIRVPIRNN